MIVALARPVFDFPIDACSVVVVGWISRGFGYPVRIIIPVAPGTIIIFDNTDCWETRTIESGVR